MANKQLILKRLNEIDIKLRNIELIMRKRAIHKMKYNYKLPI